MDTVSDPWANWRRRLAGDKTVKTYETEPDQGYYRQAIKQKTAGGASKTVGWVPVAFWYDGGDLFCAVGIGDDRVNPDRDKATALWIWVSGSPITEEQYRAVADRGEPWFDAPHTGVAPPARGSVVGDNQPPANDAPAADPLAELRETIESAIGAVKDLKVTSDEEAARAQASRARLLELSGTADKLREEEKAPHLKAGCEVDEKYRQLVQDPKAAADTIRKELSAHETRKLQAARAAEEAARKAAEEAERAAEKARRQHKAVPAPPPPPPPVPERAATIKGGYGKAASVRTVKKAKIVDLGKVLTHLIGKRNEKLILLIAAEAQREVDAGIDVPGVEVVEEAVVT